MAAALFIVPVNPVPALRTCALVLRYGLVSCLDTSVTLFLVAICALIRVLVAPLRAQLVVISTAVLELTVTLVLRLASGVTIPVILMLLNCRVTAAQ